jgi:type III secretion system YscI/HrpB-like protein
MTEVLPVEAIRAATPAADPSLPGGAAAPAAVADPSAVAKFEAAMATPPVGAPSPVSSIPFASEAAAAWRTAHVDNQGILHRIRALTELGATHTPAAVELVELQYEVANLSFQQEVVTKVADKTSTAIQTLVKNQ